MQVETEDSQRRLEQQALLNVRSLVDKLERDERKGPWPQMLVLIGLAFIVVGAVAIAIGFVANPKPAYVVTAQPGTQVRALPQPPSKADCVREQFNRQASEFERNARAANPQLSTNEIWNRFESQRLAAMTAAQAACN